MVLFFSASSRFRLALFSACMASKGPIMAEIIINIQYQGIASSCCPCHPDRSPPCHPDRSPPCHPDRSGGISFATGQTPSQERIPLLFRITNYHLSRRYARRTHPFECRVSFRVFECRALPDPSFIFPLPRISYHKVRCPILSHSVPFSSLPIFSSFSEASVSTLSVYRLICPEISAPDLIPFNFIISQSDRCNLL